jgi:putative transposase
VHCYGVVRELDPRAHQLTGLRQAVGASRFAQNAVLARVRDAIDIGTPMSWSAISLHTLWRQIRSELAPWYGEVSKEAFQSGCERAANALANWNSSRKGKRAGRKVGFPRFRKRGSNDSVTFTAATLRASGEVIHLPRIGDVLLKEMYVLPAGARITAATVRSRAGRWFVSLRVRKDDWTEPAKRSGSTAGVDFGLLSFAAVSDGTVVASPRFFRSDAKRLARAQVSLSRKRKGSQNRRKARENVARVHYRIACRRQDFLHKFTTSLVKSHARIVVEDLNLVGMSRRNKAGFKLGKSVHDAAIGEARRQLDYKASWYGTQLLVADRWFPSTKLCSVCGAVNDVDLSTRLYVCACGARIHRDLNAAVNLHNLAGSSPVAARGADVSLGLVLAVGNEAGRDVA